MTIEGKYLDEILMNLYQQLTESTDRFSASKGAGHDLLAQKITLKDPRARISATSTRGMLISGLAEFCWYLSGSSDLNFIRFYLPKYPPKGVVGNIYDAYGPRITGSGDFGFTQNQLRRAIDRLARKPDSRRAVISILEQSDLTEGAKEAPCTVALQFIRRRKRLHLVAMMRSNDAFLGFPHDVFCFTMIQEIVARALGVGVGDYHHFAASLHLYEQDFTKIENYLNEGFQNPKFAMPKMPSGDQSKSLEKFLAVEKNIREGHITFASEIALPSYWKDLALVLLRYADTKFKRGTAHMKDNFSCISHDFYRNFFVKKPMLVKIKAKEELQQENLGLEE